jgi:hypothetical protein
MIELSHCIEYMHFLMYLNIEKCTEPNQNYQSNLLRWNKFRLLHYTELEVHNAFLGS